MTTEQRDNLIAVLCFAIFKIDKLAKELTDPQDKEIVETVNKQLMAILSVCGGLIGIFTVMDYIRKHQNEEEEEPK